MRTPDLITWDASSKHRQFDKSPRIGFTKSGVISLNPSAQALLGITAGDYIIFYQDRNEPKSWWVAKSDAEHGVVTRAIKKGGSKNLLVNWSAVAKTFRSSTGQSGSCRCQVDIEAVEGKYELITAALKS
jgi:hypothetical protein